MKLKELKVGQLAVVLIGTFRGEIFYRSVRGVHSLSVDRFWPTGDFRKDLGLHNHYEGPLDEEVELIDKDRLKDLAPTTPVVEVIEVGNNKEYTLLDYIRTGSSVAKLLWDLETVHLLRDRKASVVAVYSAQGFARARATQVSKRVIHYAMRELSNGYDRRVTTVRDFIHNAEDGE